MPLRRARRPLRSNGDDGSPACDAAGTSTPAHSALPSPARSRSATPGATAEADVHRGSVLGLDGRASRRARGYRAPRHLLRQRRPRRAEASGRGGGTAVSRRVGPTWGRSSAPWSTPSWRPRWRAHCGWRSSIVRCHHTQRRRSPVSPSGTRLSRSPSEAASVRMTSWVVASGTLPMRCTRPRAGVSVIECLLGIGLAYTTSRCASVSSFPRAVS